MPEKKAQQRRPPAKKQASARKPVPTRKPRKVEKSTAVDRTTELSEDLVKSLDEGARNALDAMRNFIETVEEALPLRGEGPRRREEITDSALDMAQRLIDTQYEFLSKVVDYRRERIRHRGDRRRESPPPCEQKAGEIRRGVTRQREGSRRRRTAGRNVHPEHRVDAADGS